MSQEEDIIETFLPSADSSREILPVKTLEPVKSTRRETSYRFWQGQASGGQSNGWQSIFLNRFIFLAFAVFFGAMIGVLQGLVIIGKRNDGLWTVPSSATVSYYFAKFAPTAIIVLVSYLWENVDSRIRRLQPWVALSNGPVSAHRSLLVLYTSLGSSSPLGAMWKGHWAVAFSMLGWTWLDTLSSTTSLLFSSQAVYVNSTAQARAAQTFDRRSYDPTQVDAKVTFDAVKRIKTDSIRIGVPYNTFQRYTDTVVPISFAGDYSTDDGESNTGVYIRDNSFGVPHPLSLYEITSPNSTDTFLPPLRPRPSGLLATVDGFHADLDCEEATVNSTFVPDTNFVSSSTLNNPNVFPYRGYYNLSLSSPSCEIGGLKFDPGPVSTVQSDNFRFKSVQLKLNCDGRNQSEEGQRLAVISIASLGVNITYGASGNNDTSSWSAAPGGSLSILCRPTYSIEKVLVSLNQTGAVQTLSVIPGQNSTTLLNVTAWDIADGVLSSLAAASNSTEMLTGWINHGTPWGFTGNVDIFTGLIGLESSYNGSWSPSSIDAEYSLQELGAWFDQMTLPFQTRYIYSTLAASLAQRYLLTNNTQGKDDVIPAQLQSTKQRAFLVQNYLINVYALLGGLCLTSLFLCSWILNRRISRDPDNIAVIAAILASSAPTANIIEGISKVLLERGEKDGLKELKKRRFQSVVDRSASEMSVPEFCLESELAPKGKGVRPAKKAKVQSTSASFALWLRIRTWLYKHPDGWWRPFSFTNLFIIQTILIPVAFIVALEVTYVHSKRLLGLEVIGTLPILYQALPVFIATQLLWILKYFERDVKITHPLRLMEDGPAAANGVLFLALLGAAPHTCLWYGVGRRANLPIAFMTIAVLLSAIIVVLSNNIYNAEFVNMVQLPVHGAYVSTNLTLEGPSHSKSGFTNEAGVVTSLIQHHNMSWPFGTYEDLFLPTINFDLSRQNTTQDLINATSMNFLFGGFRGALDCRSVALKSEAATFNPSDSALSLPYTTLDGICCNFELESNTTCTFANETLRTTTQSFPAPRNGYFGRTGMLPGCTSWQGVAVYFGHLTDGKVDNLTVNACLPALDSIDIDTTLTRFLSIHAQYRPVPIESSARHFANLSLLPTSHRDFLSFTPSNNESANYPLLDVLEPISYSADDKFDTFFQALVYGKNGVPAEELLNQTKLIDSVTQLYRVYVAQAMNQIRTDVNTPPVSGSYDTTSFQLIRQSVPVTRAIQVLLSVILLLVILTYISVNRSFALPYHPMSIFGLMLLLVGSRLVTREYFPAGGEYWSDEKMVHGGLFSGVKLRLGWWKMPASTVDGEHGDYESTAEEDGDEWRRFGIGIEGVDARSD